MTHCTLRAWKFAACSMTLMFFLAVPVHAQTTWTNWTSNTLSTGTSGNGAAAGSVGGVGVTYSGELNSQTNISGTTSIWSPNSSFTGGTVTVSPSIVGDELALAGAFTGTNTITFASPVTNPLFAIWSLGQSFQASFTFNATPTLQAGGPNSQFGGSSITVDNNVVRGNEGNGVVQFNGTFSSISWTDTPEFFYAFTVGVNGPSSSVPEPSSLVLLGSAFGGFIWWSRRNRR